jgi:hypothetical protein
MTRQNGSQAPSDPTVALVVTHGFTARMFLRSSLIDELLPRTAHVGVFAPPESLGALQAEFSGPAFSFYPLVGEERGRDVVADYLRVLFSNWQLTPTRRIREQEKWLLRPGRRLFWPLRRRFGSAHRLRRGWYEMENRWIPDRDHADAFARLRPDVVVTATPGVLPGDIRLIRRARLEGVPSVTFVQGWDNLTSKTIIGARPDELIVWNRRMRDEAIALHGYRPSEITVTGAPHFDPYFKRHGWVPKDEFLRSLGLDPSKRIVLYATSPYRYFAETVEVIDMLVAAHEAGALGADTQLVVRLHPQVLLGPDADDLGKYERFRGKVYLDIPAGKTGLPADYTPDGIRHLGQLLEASAVTINVASSFTIDACIFDRPVVNVGFDGRRSKPYLRSVRRHYDTDHYGYVVQTGAVRVAETPEMLFDEVRRYLADDSLERANRAQLLDDLCYKHDGRSGERVAQKIVEIGRRARAGAREAEPSPALPR